jgi:hypothetical protein
MCLPTLLPGRPDLVGASSLRIRDKPALRCVLCCVQSSLPCVGFADMGSRAPLMAMSGGLLPIETLSAKEDKELARPVVEST